MSPRGRPAGAAPPRAPGGRGPAVAGAAPGHQVLAGVLAGHHPAAADYRHVHGGGDKVDHPDGDRLEGGAGEAAAAPAQGGTAGFDVDRHGGEGGGEGQGGGAGGNDGGGDAHDGGD